MAAGGVVRVERIEGNCFHDAHGMRATHENSNEGFSRRMCLNAVTVRRQRRERIEKKKTSHVGRVEHLGSEGEKAQGAA